MAASSPQIAQSRAHPWYWELAGEAVLLLGGSDDDNPFQWPAETLVPHLDLLSSVGGNFIRNTLSDRDPGNVYAFRGEDGQYRPWDWNREYFDRLEFFLDRTAERGIVPQITLWDQHDLTGTKWDTHPWNPMNNNVGRDESGLFTAADFYRSVERRNALILPYQEKYIEKVLSLTLEYDHVLYNITNEGWAGEAWECHWARRIHDAAAARGKRVHVTNMLHGPGMSVESMIRRADLFTYAEISQNNNYSTGYRGREHWGRIQHWRAMIRKSTGPRPLNNEKIYGSPTPVRPSVGTDRDAMDRFWRIVFGGCASARFHRPEGGWGLGLSQPVQAAIRAVRELETRFPIVKSAPAPERIAAAESLEAYCLAHPDGACAVYLTQGGEVRLHQDSRTLTGPVRWLAPDGTGWMEAKPTEQDGAIVLQPPTDAPSVALLGTR